jgi:hypothetical protein
MYSNISKSLFMNQNRVLYRKFIRNLQELTDIKNSENLKKFLTLWNNELEDNQKFKEIFKKGSEQITKKEMIQRVVEILRKDYKLPAKEVK